MVRVFLYTWAAIQGLGGAVAVGSIAALGDKGAIPSSPLWISMMVLASFAAFSAWVPLLLAIHRNKKIIKEEV